MITSLSTTTAPDGWLQNILERLVPGDYTALVFTFRDDAVFDAEKAKSLDGKPLVVLDFAEYGYDESWRNNHLLGVKNHFERVVPNRDYYDRLHEWVSRQNIRVFFKREFSIPITEMWSNGYYSGFPIYPVDLISEKVPRCVINKDQWMARRGGVFHLYGYSHMDRKRLHGALQARWPRTINNLMAMQECINREAQFHLLEQVEWWSRYQLGAVLNAQQQCMISVGLPGYGVKCFRNAEACYSCVPAVADLGLKWSVPWTEENAIMLPMVNGALDVPRAVEVLEKALEDKEALYNHAVNAADSCNEYQVDHYVEKYINQHIRNHL